jgi:DNA-binding IclR family transcriptional regulator
LTRALTQREQEVLDAIREITADGWPASVREIATARGNSISSTYEALGTLIDLDAVREHPRRGKGGYLPNPEFVAP